MPENENPVAEWASKDIYFKNIMESIGCDA
jgi:hypothetical protein